PLLEKLGVASRVRLESGDFFKAVPAGDSYVMKHILHDWDDDRASTILRNCRAAMRDPKHGKVILLEAVVPTGDRPHFSKVIDLEMLTLPGGRERTGQEWAALFARSGLRLN